ncbi:hypothetical protein BDW02DRAFT_564104 [Decorospora gaudefroyi]|uniref:Ima1 N-terminal domain-containing protein n=1 Tax=Decorospora gaudefroyi TaxID=184978 RepID=A0A6A5KSE4_9PLEO|nr:hypothetical protein BDW02DRAFT_564104 [Decorospora gaudefroyi]
MSASADDVFCDMCQRNQTLYTGLLAEFLPDEDDAEYDKYLAAYDEYKAELEERYPQVCSHCLPRVQDQIRNANHVARADNLARIMEASKERRTTVQTSRQVWTLTAISLAKWTYLLSTTVGMLWHAVALLMAPDEGFWADQTFSWDTCFTQAFFVRSVDQSCILSPYMVRLLQYAITADLFTIWWNPKLKIKTSSLTGRMRGLKSLWLIRASVVFLRFATLHYWQSAPIGYNTLKNFRNTHLAMLAVLTLSAVLTWKTVHIVYGSAPVFRKAPNEPILAAPGSAEKTGRGSYHPAHPQADIYDGMAHALASGIEGYQESSPLPPSPTLTEASYTSHATDATTPFAQRTAFLGADDMDWTPTKGRFSSQPPEVIPNPWSKGPPQQPSPPPQPKEPHSIFSRPDPNPFRHRVPAVPRSDAQVKTNPWKPSVWAPPLKENMPNFFKEGEKARGGAGENKGLDGLGVPKNVKRDAELFASPKLKYDYYGTPKDTGLEDTFNSMFSK